MVWPSPLLWASSKVLAITAGGVLWSRNATLEGDSLRLRELPDPASQAIQAREIAHALTGISGIPSAQVHLIYGPAAQGRIALGGELS